MLTGRQSMTSKSPHFLLFSEASQDPCSSRTWRFVLQDVETRRRFCAADVEPGMCSERLELLAVVRGLEALDGPARVTLVTKSRYVSRGIKSGLAEWRGNGWRWEHFGRIVPVRDHDLWQRVDRALEYHQVDCQAWHFESSASESAAKNSTVFSFEAPGFSRRSEPRNSALSRTARRGGNIPKRRETKPRPTNRILGRLQAGVRRASHLPDAVWNLARPVQETLGAST